ncbi:hypothetical protein [Actinorhabdospora filicis]|nr:hypothetical protein [Actinorhabdospora filicis]
MMKSRKSVRKAAASLLVAAALATGATGLVQAGTAGTASAGERAVEALGQVPGTIYYSLNDTVYAFQPSVGATPKPVFTMPGGGSTGLATVSGDGRHLAYYTKGSAYPKQNLVVRDLVKGTDKVVYRDLVQNGGPCASPEWAPDGKSVVGVLNGRNLNWIEVATAKVIATTTLPGCQPFKPSVNPAGGYDVNMVAGFDFEFARVAPNGTVTTFPNVSAALKARGAERGVTDIVAMGREGSRACVTTLDPNSWRPQYCEVSVDVTSGEVYFERTADSPGITLPLADGTNLDATIGDVTRYDWEGNAYQHSVVPVSLYNASVIGYKP